MPLRTRIFILISVVVLVVLGISVLILLTRHRTPQPTNTTTIQTGDNTTANTTDQLNFNSANGADNGTSLPIKPLSDAEQISFGIKKLAKIFIERYYTYSTDSNYQNIRDVADLVTPTLWQKVSGRMQTPATSTPNFMGVTTAVLSVSIDAQSDSSVTAVVRTRQELTKDGHDTTRYQNYQVVFVKQNTNWLVNSIQLAD